MLIEQVELKNIKPYEERTFEFARGINVLSGPNGSGKSTVFEAIGYALFGVEAQTFIGKAERFVRKGAKRGHVRVHFRADNGQRYVIERRVGTDSAWRLAEKKGDGTEEVIEVKNNDELEGVLKKILFTDTSAVSGKLAKYFLDVIGPLQNEFLGPFVKKGQPRIDEFDRILGISAWREAYKRSSQLESEAKNCITQRKNLLVEKQNQVVDYDQVAADLKMAKQLLAERRGVLAAVSTELRQTTERLNTFEQLRTELERLEKERDREQQQHGRVEVSKQAKEENLVQARAAKKTCNENADAHAAYRRADKQLQRLRLEQKQAEALQRRIDALEKQIEKQRGQIESGKMNLLEQESQLKENLEASERQLRDLEKQMQELQTQGQQAKADRDAYKAFADRLAEVDQVSAVRDAALRLIDDLMAVNQEVTEYQLSLKEKEPLEREAGEQRVAQEELNRLTTEQATLTTRKQQFKEGNEKLAGGQCPFFAEACLNLKEKAQPPSDFFGTRIAELEKQEQALVVQLNQLTLRLETAREAQRSLARLEQVEKQLEKAKSRANELTTQLENCVRPLVEGALVEDLRQWIETAPAEPQRAELDQVNERLRLAEFQFPEQPREQRSAVEAFAEAWRDVIVELKEVAESRLATLDQQYSSQRERYAACQAEAKQIGEAHKKYEKEEQQVATKRTTLKNQERELIGKVRERDALVDEAKQYQDLPRRIEEQEAILASTRTGYSAYEQNKKQAEQVEQLEREIKEIGEKLATSVRKLTELEAELKRRCAAYDERTHQETRQRQTTLTAQQASLSTEIHSMEVNAARLEQEKTRMEAIRQEIRTLKIEIERYKKTQKFIQDLRAQVFNKVSERLSERFREQVSRWADRIYRVIAGSDEELRWGLGYSIELADFQQGQERVRSDEELSGGEMMNAVVALRLALLQTTGAKIGFFDEPTSNLDESRRANLAQAFRSLDVGQGEVGEAWYDQLFLISHDVAFTEITDQIIHLARENQE